MDIQMKESTESNNTLSSDDELAEAERYWSIDANTYEEKNKIDDDDDSSSSEDDNDDDDDELSDHHKETPDFQNLDWSDVPRFIHSMDQGPMNRYDREKARQNKEKLLRLRRHLVDKNLILRPIYKGNGFHLYSVNEFQQKVSDFIIQKDIYSLVKRLYYPNVNASQKCLANIVDQVQTTLDHLFHSQHITEAQYSSMSINRSLVRLNYLYFVANTCEVEIPVQPIIVCKNGPTMSIAHCLGRLIGLLFNEATHCKLFSKSVDVIHNLEYYCQSGHLQPTTLFASFNINDLCMNFSHQNALDALERFLRSYVFDHVIKGMTIDTILQLVRLVLDNQYFVYDNKLYRQIAGGASGSPLTIPLVYIYLFYWQEDLMRTFLNKNELFGRYQDEAFITWNRSEDELRTLLALADSQFPQNIWNTTVIGNTIDFRDIELGHDNGILRTSFNDRESLFENDVLRQYRDIMERPIDDIWRWLRAALLKAVQYCSDEETFEDAKLGIKLILQWNGFSNDTFDEGLREFIDQFGVFITYPPFTRTSYEILRQHVFNYDKHRRATKTQREIQRKEQITLHLPYTPHWDKAVMTKFEKELNNLLKERFDDHSQMKDFWIKILSRRSSPLPIKDLLIRRRPPIRFLTLSDMEKNKKGAS